MHINCSIWRLRIFKVIQKYGVYGTNGHVHMLQKNRDTYCHHKYGIKCKSLLEDLRCTITSKNCLLLGCRDVMTISNQS